MQQNHFTLIVVGENHRELVSKYDKNLKVEPFIAIRFSEAKKYHDKYVNFYQSVIDNNTISEEMKEMAKLTLDEIKNQDDIDFYIDLCDNLDYEINEDTGDAYCTKNPNGFYDHCKIGKELSMPLKDLEGNEIFSARKSEIDWSAIHLANTYPYEVAWDTVMDGKNPQGKREEELYENMKNRTGYFEKFGNKENYVACSTAFWGYAFLDKNGWVELEDNMDQFEWVTNFYSRFVEPLDDNELITVYECVRN